jgi:hypothetical protein
VLATARNSDSDSECGSRTPIPAQTPHQHSGAATSDDAEQISEAEDRGATEKRDSLLWSGIGATQQEVRKGGDRVSLGEGRSRSMEEGGEEELLVEA